MFAGIPIYSEACMSVFVTTVTDKSFIQNLVYYSKYSMLYSFQFSR